MEEVIVHIGMHKTGSTSIQESLNGYDDGSTFYANLESANHSFAIYTIFSSARYEYHWKSQGLNRQAIDLKRQNYLNILIAELKRKDRKRLIISGEDIGYLSNEEKKQFIDFLKNYCKKIKIICYVRSPLSFASSAFSQILETGKISHKSPALYKHRIQGFIDQENVDVELKIYDKNTLFNSDVVDDFCKIINLNLDLIKKFNTNISYSEATIKIIYKFLMGNPCVVGDAVVTNARRKFFAKIADLYADYPPLKKDYFYFMVDWEDARYLDKNFNIIFDDKLESFESSKDSLNAYLSDLSEIDLSRIDRALIENNIFGNFEDIESKLNRLFYSYLDIKRLLNNSKYEGRLGGFNGRKIFGWAYYIDSEDPVSIDILINNTKVTNLLANCYRSDLNAKYKKSCAFNFEVPEWVILKTGDQLRARIANDSRDLDNSPFEVLL